MAPERYTERLGKIVRTDEAFDAWTSGELGRMVAALDKKTNKIDRHFLLMGIVEATYKQRRSPEMAELCSQIAELHLAEFPSMVKALKKDMGGVLPRVPTFQLYATLLAERRQHPRAIEVCEQAISYKLHDGTKSDFAGRIARIKKDAGDPVV